MDGPQIALLCRRKRLRRNPYLHQGQNLSPHIDYLKSDGDWSSEKGRDSASNSGCIVPVKRVLTVAGNGFRLSSLAGWLRYMKPSLRKGHARDAAGGSLPLLLP